MLPASPKTGLRTNGRSARVPRSPEAGALLLPASRPPAGTGMLRPAPRQGSGRMADRPGSPGARRRCACAACVAAPPLGQCRCPPHGPASTAQHSGKSESRLATAGEAGKPGPPTHSGTRLSPLTSSRTSPLGPGPGWKSQQGPDRLFAPTQEEAQPVLCRGPCSLQAPATKLGQPHTAGEDPQRQEKAGASKN